MLSKNEARIEAALRRLGRPTPEYGIDDAVALKCVLAEVLEQLSPPPKLSEVDKMYARIQHIEKHTGRCPNVLDVPPQQYDDLYREIAGQCRGGAGITYDFNRNLLSLFTQGGEVRIIKGRV